MSDPVVDDGIEFWNTQPASLDGVLGGYGTGTLPRVDALGSRLFLLYLLPSLSAVPSAIRPLSPVPFSQRTRALDVGAGIGRVTADVLLHLISDVVLLEPVNNFIREALARGRAIDLTSAWKGIGNKTRSVSFFQGTLQGFDPSHPSRNTNKLTRIGFTPLVDDTDSGFDVIWCQWCLGHLSDVDLIQFFKRSRVALRDDKSLIIVKENLCRDGEDGGARAVFDKRDSSLTRSDMAWKKIFIDVGLRLIREQVQDGLPEGLYVVKMYALR